jgi:hypothetical protein
MLERAWCDLAPGDVFRAAAKRCGLIEKNELRHGKAAK